MSQIMKAFFGLYMVLFLAVTSMGILAAFIQVVDAQDLHASMVNALEAGDFCRPVIEDCFGAVEGEDYELTLVLYHQDYTSTVVTSTGQIPEDTSDVVAAKVTMDFPYRIGFFQIDQDHRLEAYAR